MRFFRRAFLRTLSVLIVTVASSCFTLGVSAATLSLSPSTITVHVGDTFSVSTRVESVAEAINAVSTHISFPKQLVQASGISKNGSVLNFWVQEPTISNNTGVVSFEGVVLNPGYKGASGKIATVSFRALKEGVADITMTQSAVLANDGQGTNVLSKTIPTKIIISPAVIVPKAELTITSSTHNDPSLWYTANLVEITLSLPPSTEKVRYSFDTIQESLPKDETAPITTIQKTLNDGVWYFHAQAKANGVWGKVASLPIHIDSTPPVVTLDVDPITHLAIPTATDALSGIAKFVSVDTDATETEIQNGIEGQFDKNTIFVAYDNAGNKTTLESAVSKTVHITESPETVSSGVAVVVKGTTEGQQKISLFAKRIPTPSFLSPVVTYTAVKEGEYDFSTTAIVTSTTFSGTFDSLPVGVYTIFAKTDGGLLSNTVFIKVTSSFWSVLWLFILDWWYVPLLLLLFIVVIRLVQRWVQNRKTTPNRQYQQQLPQVPREANDRYTVLLQKIELGIPLSLEERIFVQKLRRYLVDGVDKDAK